jgi:hypothetical protein
VAGGSAFSVGGTATTDESSYFLTWDRVHIALGAEAAVTQFHVILPDIFPPPGAQPIDYQIAFGVYDASSRLYNYYYHLPLYYSATPSSPKVFSAVFNTQLTFDI